MAIGEPARDTLNGLGFAEDPLFDCLPVQRKRIQNTTGDLFITDWMWMCTELPLPGVDRVEVRGADGKPLRVSLMRMRLSVQVHQG